MKNVINIGGNNLKTILGNVITGSKETAPLQMGFCYAFQSQSGAWACFNDRGYDLTIPPATAPGANTLYHGGQLQFMWPTLDSQAGSSDSKAELTCFPCSDNPLIASTISFFSQFQQGLYDGMPAWVYQVFFQGQYNPIGLVVAYMGFIGQSKTTREKIVLELNSLLFYANARLPRVMYQPGCVHALYDAGCTLNRNSFSHFDTVSSIDGTLPQQQIHMNGNILDPGTFSQGAVQFSTGLNAGLWRTIKNDFKTSWLLMSPLPNTPSVGDQFTGFWGCDKQNSTCTAKFNNIIHYRGYPVIPTEQILY